MTNLFNELCKISVQSPNLLKNGFMYRNDDTGFRTWYDKNFNLFEIGNKDIFEKLKVERVVVLKNYLFFSVRNM